jgi:ELWxxDGT repeat protein
VLQFVLAFALAQPVLALDLDPGQVVRTSGANGFFELRPGVVLFSASGEFGQELWVTDGTPGGAHLLADLAPGPDSSYPGRFFHIGALAGFLASDGAGVFNLWSTDGTAAGTRRVAPGHPNQNVVANTTGTFAIVQLANPPSAWDLFEWDGVSLQALTTVGQQMIQAVASDTTIFISFPSFVTSTALDGFFVKGQPPVLVTGPALRAALSVDDTTPGNPVVLASLNIGGANLVRLTPTGSAPLTNWPLVPNVFANRAWRFGSTTILDELLPANAGEALVLSDGVSVSPLSALPAQTEIFDRVGGEIVSAVWGRNAFTLRASSPSGASRVVGSTSNWLGFPARWLPVGSHFFVFNSTGTLLDADLVGGGLSSKSTPLGTAPWDVASTSGDGLVSSATSLYALPSTGVLRPLGDLFLQGQSSAPRGLAVASQQVVFTANLDGGTAFFAFPTEDGGVRKVFEVDVSGVSGRPPLTSGDLAVFVAPGVRESAVYSLDTASPGAAPVVMDDTVGAGPELVEHLGSTFVYVASHPETGREPFVTDGTPAGTTLLVDLQPGVGGSNPSQFVREGNRLFFVADDGVHGRELWSTDGTSGGTALVADVRPGALDASPSSVTAFGAGVAFAANDGVHGLELWVSDESGTRLAVDLAPGSTGANPRSLVASGGHLYFVADDGAGEALFAWDGTLARRLASRGALAGAALLAAPIAGDRLVFVNVDATTGSELWLADGAGAALLVDLTAGSASTTFGQAWSFGGRAYFSADDGVTGLELRVTDGTAAGTALLANLAPGAMASSPAELTQVGRTLYFAATGPALDRELYRLEVPSLADNTPPRVTAAFARPPDHDGWYQRAVDLRFTVVDAESTPTTTGCDPVALGEQTTGREITCRAVSEGGAASATVAFKIDTVAPVLTCPMDVRVESNTEAPVTYEASAVDDLAGPLPVALAPPSGSVFPLGSSAVVASAVDPAGNLATCTFTVNVTLPVSTPPPVVASGCQSVAGLEPFALALALGLAWRRRRA